MLVYLSAFFLEELTQSTWESAESQPAMCQEGWAAGLFGEANPLRSGFHGRSDVGSLVGTCWDLGFSVNC
jgi:hypothetical protein